MVFSVQDYLDADFFAHQDFIGSLSVSMPVIDPDTIRVDFEYE